MKFYNKVSTIVNHILAYFLKLHRKDALAIFKPYYQDLTYEAKQKENQLYFNNKLKLNKVINNEVDLE